MVSKQFLSYTSALTNNGLKSDRNGLPPQRNTTHPNFWRKPIQGRKAPDPHAFASDHCCLVVTCWESADLLALVCGV